MALKEQRISPAKTENGKKQSDAKYRSIEGLAPLLLVSVLSLVTVGMASGSFRMIMESYTARDSVQRFSVRKGSPTKRRQGGSKPNILLITTDQQRFDAIRRVQDELEYYNNVTKVRTPNLDKLSKDGVYFRNAYTQCSVCAPARATMRTGCTVERTGIQTNDLPKNFAGSPLFQERVKSLETIDQILSQNGYTSEYYGKWHLPDVFWNPIQYNDYDYEKEEFALNRDDFLLKYTARLRPCRKRGEISKQLAQGQQKNPSLYPYTPARIDPRYGMPPGVDLKVTNNFTKWEVSDVNVCGEDSLESQYSSSYYIADTSIKALRRLSGQKKPFFLTASFNSPHPPFVATHKYAKYYKQEYQNLFVPHSLYANLSNSAYKSISLRMPKYYNYDMVQEWTAFYYALVEEVDDMVGKLLNELGDHRNNTLVIFTSDHGEHLGAHGDRSKNTFYEEASHVPLFVSFQGVIPAATTVEHLVSHLDLVATILDYAGLSHLDKSDGTSMRPKIEKQSYNKDYEENVVVAEWDYRDFQPTDPLSLTKSLDGELAFMVRYGRYKLMLRKKADSHRMDMMFDLKKDPFEINNMLGLNAPTATAKTREKAEHLRCLLLDWMHRMDSGGTKYYSDPLANGGEGRGDIEEIRNRQSWPSLAFWKSHSKIEVGPLVWNGTHYTRNEYLYFGRRIDGKGLIKTIRVVGDDAGLLGLELDGGLEDIELREKECVRLKIIFAVKDLETFSGNFEATVQLRGQFPSQDMDCDIPILWTKVSSNF